MIIDIQRYWGEREIYYPGELSSKIIYSMQNDGWVTLRSKEVRGSALSGLYSLLDQLCHNWNWNHKDITIETGNLYDLMAPYSQYTHKLSWLSESFINTNTNIIEHRPWNREKTYGMFIGRANLTRLRATQNHRHFEFRDQGLTSFNHNVADHIDPLYLLEYLCQTDQPFSEVKKLTPYSDIGPVQTPPITGQFSSLDWNDIYERLQ